MKPKFKIGPAKTRDGREARIYALDGDYRTPIHGAFKQYSAWGLCNWTQEGSFYVADGTADSDRDLMPNVEPEVYEFECEWSGGSGKALYPIFIGQSVPQRCLVGKRTKVRIEVLE